MSGWRLLVIVLVSLVIDAVAFYAVYRFVEAFVTWPVIKVASAVAIFGVLAFWAGDMLPELRIHAEERR